MQPEGELKYFDTQYTQSSDDQGVILSSLNLVPQGTDENERIGRKITVYQISFNGIITQSSSSDALRIILYLDKQANGANAAVSDILDTADVYSFMNLANRDCFEILQEWLFGSDTFATSGGAGKAFMQQVDIGIEVPIEFSGATGAITEVRSNNLGLLLIGFDDTASLPWVFNGTSRIFFSDK